jgi:hypothetical protein
MICSSSGNGSNRGSSCGSNDGSSDSQEWRQQEGVGRYGGWVCRGAGFGVVGRQNVEVVGCKLCGTQVCSCYGRCAAQAGHSAILLQLLLRIHCPTAVPAPAGHCQLLQETVLLARRSNCRWSMLPMQPKTTNSPQHAKTNCSRFHCAPPPLG